jgi:hypothetical protein
MFGKLVFEASPFGHGSGSRIGLDKKPRYMIHSVTDATDCTAICTRLRVV